MELEGSLLCSQQLSNTYYLHNIHLTTNLPSMLRSPNATYFHVFRRKKKYTFMSAGARGGAFGCGTELQAGWSRVRSPTLSLEFFIHLIFPAGSTKPLKVGTHLYVTAYRNAVTLQETDTIRSYELNFHPVPHGVTVSCERYTLAFPVCYGSSGRW